MGQGMTVTLMMQRNSAGGKIQPQLLRSQESTLGVRHTCGIQESKNERWGHRMPVAVMRLCLYTPTYIGKIEGECIRGTHQCLYPLKKSKSIPAPPADTFKISK